MILSTVSVCPLGHQMDASKSILLVGTFSVIQNVMSWPEQLLPGGSWRGIWDSSRA